MFTFSAETRIDRDPETVARFLADPYRYGEWTDMHDVRVLTEGPPRAGARVQATIGSGVMKVRLTWELSAFEPARLVSYRTVSDGRLGIDASYRLDALPDGGTRSRADGRAAAAA